MTMTREAKEYSAEVTAERKQRMTHKRQQSGAFYGGWVGTDTGTYRKPRRKACVRLGF